MSGIKGAWLAKEKWEGWKLNPTQSFYAIDVGQLPEDVLEAIRKVQLDYDEVQKYLTRVHESVQGRNPNIDLTEVPACLLGTAPKEEPPKQKDTEAPSSGTSPEQRKRMEFLRNMNQKKAE